MDAKNLIKTINTYTPLRMRGFAIAVVCACSLPLFLEVLPGVTFLLLSALFLCITFCFLKLNIFMYVGVFALALANFADKAEYIDQQKFSYNSAKKIIYIKAEIISFERKSNIKSTVNVRVVESCSHDLCKKEPGYSLSQGSHITLSCYHCNERYLLGDVWRFSVKLKPPRSTASWNSFDYEKYAFAKNIAAAGYFVEKDSVLIKRASGYTSKLRLLVRKKITTSLNNISNDGFSSQSLILALIIGDRSGLSPALWQTFSETGLSHLMAISGLHISLIFLIASFLSYLISSASLRLYGLLFPKHAIDECLQYFSLQSLSAFLGICCAFAYALLSGFSLPAQRALIMLIVVFVVKVFSRQISIFDMLCVAVICLLVIAPLNTLLVGFWLSVSAVAIICLLVQSNEVRWLMQARLALAMLPFSVFIFGTFPWVSPVANLIFIPIVGLLILPLTLLLLLIDFLFSVLGFTIKIHFFWNILDAVIQHSWTALELLFKFQESIQTFLVDAFQSLMKLDISSSVSFIDIGIALLFVLIMVSWRLLLARMLMLIIGFILLFVDTQENLSEGEFTLTALDVGQGLALVIETTNSLVVFDAGNDFSTSDSAKQTIIPYLNSLDTKVPDHIVISHQDSDHIGGLNSLINAYPNAKFLSNNAVVNKYSSSKEFSHIEHCFDNKWHNNGVSYHIFPRYRKAQNSNNSSCVMRVSSKYGSVLLPADIERDAEHYYILKGLVTPSDVLVAGHHGSKTSSTEAFINRVRPRVSIVSSSYFSPHGHPHKSVITRFEKYQSTVLSTALSGSIKVQFLKDGFKTREYRAKHPHFWYSQF